MIVTPVSRRCLVLTSLNRSPGFQVDTNGYISTLCGTGTAGYSGDGGFASAAQLDQPQGVAVSSNGDIYVADLNNFVIRKVIPNMRTCYRARVPLSSPLSLPPPPQKKNRSLLPPSLLWVRNCLRQCAVFSLSAYPLNHC